MAQEAASIILRGQVAVECAVLVTDMNASLNLVAGESKKTVGTVVENCNAGAGYLVTIASATGGRMTNAANQAVNYNIGYDSSEANLANPMQVSRSGAQFGKGYPIRFSSEPAGGLVAGTYSDTITVTVAAK